MEINIEDEAIAIYKKVLSGELKCFPRHFLTGKLGEVRGITMVDYLITDILHYNDEDIKKKFTLKTLKDYKLTGVSRMIFGDSTFTTLDMVYPNCFHPYELSRTSGLFWTDIENRKFIFKKICSSHGIKTYSECVKKITASYLVKDYSGLLEYYNGNINKLRKELWNTP